MTARRAGIAVATAIVLLMAVGLVSNLYSRAWSDEVTHAGSVTGVEISGDVGDITVRSGPTLRVHREFRAQVARPTAHSVVRDGWLRLSATCPVVAVNGCTVSYRLEVPAGMSLRLTSTDGEIDITGSGTGAASSGAGVAGSVWAHSSAGPVTARGLTAHVVEVSSSAGDVTVDVATAGDRLAASSSAGRVDIRVPRVTGGYDVAAISSAGDAIVAVDRGGSHRITVDSSSDDVTVRYR